MSGAPPAAVLVTGAPGAGKSTLAEALERVLRLPVLNKDRLRESALWALGTNDVGAAPWGPGLWYPLMEAHLRAGVSVVADMTLFPGVSETDMASRLAPVARLVQVHCRCRDPVGRFTARTEGDLLRNRSYVAPFLAEVEALAEQLARPLDLHCPVIEVDTDDGYSPDLEEVAGHLVALLAPHMRVPLLGGDTGQ